MAYPENVGIKAMEIYIPSQVRLYEHTFIHSGEAKPITHGQTSVSTKHYLSEPRVSQQANTLSALALSRWIFAPTGKVSWYSRVSSCVPADEIQTSAPLL